MEVPNKKGIHRIQLGLRWGEMYLSDLRWNSFPQNAMELKLLNILQREINFVDTKGNKGYGKVRKYGIRTKHQPGLY